MKRIMKLVDDDLDLSVFDRFIGRFCSDIIIELSLEMNAASKSFLRTFVDKLVESPLVDFDTSNHIVKTVRMVRPLRVKESMSLRVVDYCSMIGQKWDNSDFRKELSKKYLFFVFEGVSSIDSTLFRGVIEYSFSEEDLREAERVWSDTISKMRDGNYDTFITEKESGTFFFKIHASTASDVVTIPGGGKSVKRSFWIAKKFIDNRILTML